MTVQFNATILDQFLAPGISTFKHAEIPDLRQVHDQYSYWLANHFLESILTATYQAPYRQYVFNLLYRIQTAFLSYHEARELTFTYLSITLPNNPAIRTYFQALARWETCFLNWQILVDIFNKMSGERVFKKNENSLEERTNNICNAIKHAGSTIKREKREDSVMIPLWLSNDGFNSFEQNAISYQELASLLADAGKLADELQYTRQF